MSEKGNGAGKGIVSSALLLAAVALILVTGMVLRTSGPPRSRSVQAVAASPAPPLPLGSTITPDLQTEAPAGPAPAASPEPAAREAAPTRAPRPGAPLAPADPLVENLAARARDDCGRLAKAPLRWTAQLIVACKPQTVDRLLDAASGSTGVYVLPASVNDDACFRVCFGTYATAKEAAAAADLPKALRGKERIVAVEIVKVLP
jgi:septal ring-binding cell division protein DamX